jgi:hypothetical protein
LLILAAVSLLLAVGSIVFAFSDMPNRLPAGRHVRLIALALACMAVFQGLIPMVYDSQGAHSTAIRIAYLLGGLTSVIFLILCSRILSTITPDQYAQSWKRYGKLSPPESPETAATFARWAAVLLQLLAVIAVPVTIWLVLFPP